MTAPARQGGTIMHVLDHTFPEVSGYSVRTHNLLRALQAAGFAVIGVASSSRDRGEVEEEIDGIRYVRLPFRLEGQRQTAKVACARLLRLGRWLTAAARTRRADLIHAHSPVLNAFPALWAARRRRIPFVYELRGFWEDTAQDRTLTNDPDLRYRISRACDTLAMRSADAVTTISQGMRSAIVERGIAAERVFIAPNGVDSSAFHPRAPDEVLLKRHDLAGRFVVGFIGYFFTYEGVDELIRGFARVLPRHPNSVLLIVGTGPCAAKLHAQVERLRLGSNVIFTGAVPHEDVAGYYSVCDIVVYPRLSRRSTELTTPLKPLEAMAMGKVVVGSDVGGLRELVRDGETGLLYSHGDEQRLADALVRLAQDGALRAHLAERAREFACTERPWEMATAVYADVYKNLLQQHRPRKDRLL